jgi:hypothetical protein
MKIITKVAIALTTAVKVSILAKNGENIEKKLHDHTVMFLNSLKAHSPETVIAIEKVTDQPLDYSKAILDIEKAINQDQQVREAIQALVKAVEENNNQDITANINQENNKITPTLANETNSNTVYDNTIEKQVNFAQGNSNINIASQNITV